ncbi:hypothetical protein OG21DRAFT_1511262 [Imleria badia]|nr:hypothetical protein OG21DRAFT_1511262 [Imleria badia]
MTRVLVKWSKGRGKQCTPSPLSYRNEHAPSSRRTEFRVFDKAVRNGTSIPTDPVLPIRCPSDYPIEANILSPILHSRSSLPTSSPSRCLAIRPPSLSTLSPPPCPFPLYRSTKAPILPSFTSTPVRLVFINVNVIHLTIPRSLLTLFT